jgi:hypothetical protein
MKRFSSDGEGTPAVRSSFVQRRGAAPPLLNGRFRMIAGETSRFTDRSGCLKVVEAGVCRAAVMWLALGTMRRFLVACMLLTGTLFLFLGELRGNDSVILRYREEPGLSCRVKVLVELKGELVLNARGQGVTRLPLKATGVSVYDERAAVRLAGDEEPLHVRYYERAESTSEIGDHTQKNGLSPDQRLILVHTQGGVVSLDSPLGPLTREELELIDNQANTALLNQLLPNRAVLVGETWSHADDLVRPLLAIESIHKNNLQSRCRGMEAGLVSIDLEGTVRGSTRGVSTDLEVKGKYDFDPQHARITRFTMRLREDRAVGHAEPGIEVEAQIQIQIEPGIAAPELVDAKLAALPRPATRALQPLECFSEEGRLRFLHERDWRTMVDRHDVLILRLVQRGDLVAQCNLTRLPDVSPPHSMTRSRFEEDIRRVLGSRFGQVVEASEGRTARGLKQIRVAVTGVASEIPIRWIYHHLSDASGRQVALVFTLDEKSLPRFAATDELLVSSLEFTK